MRGADVGGVGNDVVDVAVAVVVAVVVVRVNVNGSSVGLDDVAVAVVVGSIEVEVRSIEVLRKAVVRGMCVYAGDGVRAKVGKDHPKLRGRSTLHCVCENSFSNAAGIRMQGWQGVRGSGGGVDEVKMLCWMLKDQSMLHCVGIFQFSEMDGTEAGGG